MTELEAVLFDVGGVLSEEIIDRKLADLARRHGVSLARMLAARPALRRQADLGQLTDPQFWQRVLAIVDVVAGPADWDIWPYVRAVPGTLELARQLRGRIRLGILSNDSHEMARARRGALGFDELFAPIVISAELGLAKPDPRAYEAAIARLGVERGACLFVDDREENVAAAREVGLRAELFCGAARLERVLARFGLGGEIRGRTPR